MASKTDALIEELSGIHPKGFDLSLGRITALLDKLGNPQENIPPAIHVAGTNGKGSTLAFCRSILEAGGYTVHVHTSPHLVEWNERYRLAGTLVSDSKLAEAIERAVDANNGTPITIFEIMSAVMFILFSEHEADFSLVEVGLGGRFDATNVIPRPLVTAITPVALDHQAYLGDTIQEIAFEKAGIIKDGVPVVVGQQVDEAIDTIENVARNQGSRTIVSRQDFDWYRDATGFVFQDDTGLLDLPVPRLSGDHQLANAALAIATMRAANIKLTDHDFQTGMDTVEWPGRFARLPAGKIEKLIGIGSDIWVDGGHNPAAGEIIAETLRCQRKNTPRNLLLICGMINTKEPLGFLLPFAELDVNIITVPVAESDSGIPPIELASIAEKAGLKAIAAESLDEGILSAAKFLANKPDTQILFCGSLYMVGEVLSKNGTPPK